MRELVLTCALALLGSGCVEVVSHFDDFDAGNPDVKISDAVAEPEASGGACQSGQHWTGGNTPSAVHFPGRPCLGGGCHSSTSKTPMTLAGTVYPFKGERDENDCNGINGTGVAVAPMDENGMEFAGRIQVNAVGNFYTNKAMPPSFRIKVIAGGREAVQKSTLSDGNCNYCHTPEDFMGAKGRVLPEPP